MYRAILEQHNNGKRRDGHNGTTKPSLDNGEARISIHSSGFGGNNLFIEQIIDEHF